MKLTEMAFRDLEQLVIRAAYLTDQRRWEELANLYCPEGVMVRPSDPDNPVVGREKILASLLGRAPATTRHLVSNMLVDPQSATEAHVSSLVTLYSGIAASGPRPATLRKISIGHFEDEVCLTPAGWAFRLRRGSMALEWQASLD
jgi:hypothetical protein